MRVPAHIIVKIKGNPGAMRLAAGAGTVSFHDLHHIVGDPQAA